MNDAEWRNAQTAAKKILARIDHNQKPSTTDTMKVAEALLAAARFPALEGDLEDADEVIGGLGYSRRECPHCGRRAVVRGYICWHCGMDPTMKPEVARG